MMDGMAAVSFVDQVAMDLEQSDDPECPPVKLAVKTTANWLARQIAPIVGLQPTVKFAAFSDDDGTATITLQSRTLRRRVSFHIGEDGRTIEAICIDSAMKAWTQQVSTVDGSAACELAKWLVES